MLFLTALFSLVHLLEPSLPVDDTTHVYVGRIGESLAVLYIITR